MKTPLILASVSPRRCQLLRNSGLRFRVIPAETEEASFPGDPRRTVEYNSRLKAATVAKKHPLAAVIGADTVVFASSILGKPADLREAREMLRTLAGREHRVFTGVSVIFPPDGRTATATAESVVRFKNYDDAVIERYLELVDTLDKAGAYAIQEHGEILIEKTEGSYSNIVGLPLETLAEILEKNPAAGIPADGLRRAAALRP